MAEINYSVSNQSYAPPPPTITLKFKHVVYAWGTGKQEALGRYWVFDQTYNGFRNKILYNSGTWADTSIMLIPIDPLTAIGLGLVTPEELGYPAGILAAFNLLKGNQV